MGDFNAVVGSSRYEDVDSTGTHDKGVRTNNGSRLMDIARGVRLIKNELLCTW